MALFFHHLPLGKFINKKTYFLGKVKNNNEIQSLDEKRTILKMSYS